MKMAAAYGCAALALLVGLLLVFAGPLSAVATASRLEIWGNDALDGRAASAGHSDAHAASVSDARPNQANVPPLAEGNRKVVASGDDSGLLRDARSSHGDESPRAASAGGANSQAQLQHQVDALRIRTAELEQEQLASAEQTSLLSRINEDLRTLNAQVSDAQSRGDAASAQSATRGEQSQRAIDSLGMTLASLADGDGDVGDALAAAGQALPAQSQRDLAAAQTAIDTHNLVEARAFVQAAIHDASLAPEP